MGGKQKTSIHKIPLHKFAFERPVTARGAPGGHDLAGPLQLRLGTYSGASEEKTDDHIEHNEPGESALLLSTKATVMEKWFLSDRACPTLGLTIRPRSVTALIPGSRTMRCRFHRLVTRKHRCHGMQDRFRHSTFTSASVPQLTVAIASSASYDTSAGNGALIFGTPDPGPEQTETIFARQKHTQVWELLPTLLRIKCAVSTGWDSASPRLAPQPQAASCGIFRS